MKKSVIFPVILIILSGCAGKNGEEITGSQERKIRKKVLYIAESYVKKQLKENQTRDEKDGIIILSDDQKRFVIDPGKIYPGYINEDREPDAIVSIDRYQGQYPIISENLLIFKNGKRFELITSLESDMRILGIHGMEITAEVPTHSRNSPLFYCPSCREVKKYKFSEGTLIPVE